MACLSEAAQRVCLPVPPTPHTRRDGGQQPGRAVLLSLPVLPRFTGREDQAANPAIGPGGSRFVCPDMRREVVRGVARA
jgi:hypothetical protein